MKFKYEVFTNGRPPEFRVWEPCEDCDMFVGFCYGWDAAEYFEYLGYIVERTTR